VILLSENLTRAFNGVTVVADVSIEIQLVGSRNYCPNGAGKSTTLAMLAARWLDQRTHHV